MFHLVCSSLQKFWSVSPHAIHAASQEEATLMCLQTYIATRIGKSVLKKVAAGNKYQSICLGHLQMSMHVCLYALCAALVALE